MSQVDIELIRPSPYQPRLTFKIDDMKEEIQRDGLLSPLIVRKVDGFYEIIDGERRLRTLKELGWKTATVEVRELDDRTARLAVYKLNTIRESYSVEDKARYFKKLHDGGMTFYQIGKELSVDDQWVLAHINIFKFPEDIQNAVWSGELSISHVQRLEPVIGANIEEATKIAREIILRKISVPRTEELVQERKEAVEKARVEAAKKAIGVMTPIAEVKLETPEELEKAAEALKVEARKKRENALSAEEKARIEAEKKRKEEDKRKREEERKRRLEEEAERRAKEIAQAERRQIEEEAEKKAREKLMKSREFLEQAAKTVHLTKLREEYAVSLKQARLMPMVNVLNELTGDEWLKFTRSWYEFDALESDLEEERAVTIDVEEHPATFSPTMISEYVRFFTKKDGVVLDPFVGIGSTLVACMRAGRKGIGIDIVKKYCEIARKRVQEDSKQQVICGDAWELGKYDLPQIDYCITSPPYFRMLEKIDVTQKKRIAAGLETDYGKEVVLPTGVDEYIAKLIEVFSKVADKMKDGGHLTVILQNFRDKEKMIPLAWKFATAMKDSGKWTFKGERIWCQAHKSLHPFGYPADWVPNIHHHYCLIFKRRS